MARIESRVSDQRMLKLIRTFLKAGVMEGRLVSPVDEGTPQGGPLQWRKTRHCKRFGGLMGVGRTLMFSVARKLLKELVAGEGFEPSTFGL